MTTSRNFSRPVKRAAYARSHGRCENPSCGIALPAGWGGIRYDHIVNWAISRDSSLENCQVLCADCHLWKTAQHDTPVAAKCQRIEDERIGIKRPGKKFRRDLTKKFNGQVVPRVRGKGAKHRETIMRRQIGGES